MGHSDVKADPAEATGSNQAKPEAQILDTMEKTPAATEPSSDQQPFPIFSMIAGVVLVLSLFVPKLLLIVPIIGVVSLAAIGVVRKEQPYPLPIVTGTLAVVFFIMASADVPPSLSPFEQTPGSASNIGWIVDSFKDRMSDKVTYYASLDDTTGTAHFDIHCTPEHVSYTFAGKEYLGEGERTLEYRFDRNLSQAPILNYYDKSVSMDVDIVDGHVDTATMTKAMASLLADMSFQLHDPAHKQLLVRLYGFDYMSHEYIFPLHGTSEALASLEKSCGHPV